MWHSAPLVRGSILRPRWEVEVGFRVAVVVWDGRLIWAAGSATTSRVDDYDWEALRGGGFAGLDPRDGGVVAAGALPEDVAWGTGGVSVVVLGNQLAAIGRTGRVYLRDPGRRHHGARRPRSPRPLSGWPTPTWWDTVSSSDSTGAAITSTCTDRSSLGSWLGCVELLVLVGQDRRVPGVHVPQEHFQRCRERGQLPMQAREPARIRVRSV